MKTGTWSGSPLLQRAVSRTGRRLSVWLLAGVSLLAAGVPLSQADENDAVRQAGDIGQFVPHVAGLTLALAHHDGKGAGQLALATATTLAVVHGLKPIIDRERPNGGGRSFPSGHTAMAFAGAGFVQRRYGWAYGVPAYTVSVFVGWSRVHAKEHHTSDVIAGGAIGIAANLVFTRRYRGVTVMGRPNVAGPGLALSISW
jgi:membrane-associated phospholipid phosphatase